MKLCNTAASKKEGKYIFTQNLIAPYRVALFNQLQRCNLDFSVFYMRKTEDGRSWKVNYDDMHYNYTVFKGWYLHSTKWTGNFHSHFNFGIIKYILCHQEHEIILGASWNNLNTVTLILLKRLGFLKSKLHIWTEANFLKPSALNCSRLKYFIRKFVFNSIDGNTIVASKMAQETLKHWGVSSPNIVFLPNVIQSQQLYPASSSATRPGELPMVVMSARLDKNVKGQLNFFDAIGPENVRKARFYLLGDGNDQAEYEQYIAENNYDKHIFLVGFCNFEQVADYYSKCDVFCLPSFYDACPLAILEGICMGLPMLVSNHCGNAGETVFAGDNGFLFNPYDKADIKSKFEILFEQKEQWPRMRKRSREIFSNNFETMLVVKRFIESMSK